MRVTGAGGSMRVLEAGERTSGAGGSSKLSGV